MVIESTYDNKNSMKQEKKSPRAQRQSTIISHGEILPFHWRKPLRAFQGERQVAPGIHGQARRGELVAASGKGTLVYRAPRCGVRSSLYRGEPPHRHRRYPETGKGPDR